MERGYTILDCSNNSLSVNKLRVGSVRSKCIQDQQSLSIEFKENLTFNSTLSSKLVSLNSSTYCCSWVGVKCSSSGRVIDIDLSNELIYGSIHSTNCSVLSKPISIDSRYNSLNGTIQTSLFGIPSLQSLYLNNNQFTRGFDRVSKLAFSALKFLDLGHNKLSGTFPMFIFGF